jgi:uncharacterized protein (TIGR02284 family)
MSNQSELIEGLNGLLTKNYDAEAGYKEAAENTGSPILTNFFKEKAAQRYQFGHEIKLEIKSLGGKPDKGTSLIGDAHRTWINFKSALAFNTEEAILEECERGEKASVEEYDNFLTKHDMPASTRNIVLNQRNKINQSLRRVEVLENHYDA